MKIKPTAKAFLVTLLLLAAAMPPLRATEVFTLDFTVPGLPPLACGMDTDSLDGLDNSATMQDVIAPPSAPTGKIVKFINNGFSTGMYKDIRQPANDMTWQLNVSNLANPGSLVLSWPTLAIGDATFFTNNHASLLLRGNGADVIIYESGASYVHGSTTLSQNGSYYLVLQSGANAPPAAGADHVLAMKEQSIAIEVLANDSDPDGDTLIVTATGATSAGGTAALAGDNKTITYTPPVNYSGAYPFEDSFTYTVSDQFAGPGGPGTATGTVTVQVAEVVATRRHTHYGNPAGSLTVTVTVAYAGAAADVIPLTIEEFLPVRDDNAGSWTYVADSFQPPDGTPDATAIQAAGSNKLTLHFPTVPASAFSFSYQVGIPAMESAVKSITGRVFAQSATDPVAEIPATEVIPLFVNRPPEIAAVTPGGLGNTPQDPAPIDEGASLAFTVSAKDDNPEQVEPLTIAGVDWYIDDELQTPTREAPSGSFTFATTFDTVATVDGLRPRFRIVAIKAVVRDPFGTPATNGVTTVTWHVTVNDIDRSPTAPEIAVSPAAPTTSAALTATVAAPAIDDDNDTIVGYSYSWSKGETIIPGAVLGAAQTRKHDSWTMTVKAITNPYGDGAFASPNAATQIIAIDNTAPLANGQSVTTPEDTGKAILLTGSDPDVVEETDTLAFAIAAGPAHGELLNFNGANGTVVYQPAADYHGPDSFYFTAGDGAVTSDPTPVEITVGPVNDPPVAVDDTLAAIAEDSGVSSIPFAALTGNDHTGPLNEDAQTLTIAVAGNAVGGTVAINVSEATVEFSPASNFNGPASFEYTVQDNGATNGVDDFLTAVGTASFTVTAVNDPPVIAVAPVKVPENAGFQSLDNWISATPGPPDEDGQELTFDNVIGISNPDLFTELPQLLPGSGPGNRTLTFQIKPHISAGVAEITVQAHDNGGTTAGGADTAEATFEIRLDGWAVTFTIARDTQSHDLIVGMNSAGSGNVIAAHDADFYLSATPDPAWYSSCFHEIANKAIWYLHVKAGDLAGNLQLSWPQDQLPQGKTLAIYELDSNNVIKAETFRHLDLPYANQEAIAIGGGADRTYAIHYHAPGAADEMVDLIPFAPGWNLISLPLEPSLADFDKLLVDGQGARIYRGCVYAYEQERYKAATAAEALHGYWVFADSAGVVPVTGRPVVETTVHLNYGWNLFGPAVHRAVPATISGPAWVLRGTHYLQPDFLETAMGYWFFVDESSGVDIDLGR